MNLISCCLQLENSSVSYRPGEVIKGLAVFNVNGSSAILIKALSIQFSGYASCKWEKEQAKNKKNAKPKPKEYYVNREDYVFTKNYLLGSEEANPTAITPGIYNYNFMVQIPINAPSSFNGAWGSIVYELQAHADYITNLDCLCCSVITVEQLKDLRCWAPAMQNPNEKSQREPKSFLKFWRNPLQVYANIPQSGYVPGECISVHIKVANHGHLKLKDITSKLNRIVTYKGSWKEKKSQETREVTAIACNVYSMFGQNSSDIQHIQQLVVPKTVPTLEFSECNCISVTYEVEVSVSAQRKLRSVCAILPIVVGSVSLRSDVKLVEENVSSNHVSTITVARSMDELNLPSSWDMREQNQNIQAMDEISVSMMSLASSFREAEYMTAVKINKKSKNNLNGEVTDFKPKYLYFDLPEEMQPHLEDDMPTTSQSQSRPIIVAKSTDAKF
ncbi:arrestin domain-containing protein 2 [Musca vetustissima]|uniref:arrestin domain-containing protein 2 n=1 Tax=Musca vetustissima TaxID=27455 RepID=UPI002AB79607|nr:arrestin domain-containing protein 2 [Musca vetustissima]